MELSKQPIFTPSDRRLAWASFFMGCTMMSIPLPGAVSCGGIMMGMATAIYYGLAINNKALSQEKQEEAIRLSQQSAHQTLLFRCRYKALEKGSAWEIANRNRFPWTSAKVLIERTVNGKKTTEKHRLGEVPSASKARINSKLDDQVGAQWRVMVLSYEGQMLDFPDKVQESDLKRSIAQPHKNG